MGVVLRQLVEGQAREPETRVILSNPGFLPDRLQMSHTRCVTVKSDMKIK